MTSFGVQRLDAALTFGLSFISLLLGSSKERPKAQEKRCQAAALQSALEFCGMTQL
jgi:hypothetical protein